METNRGIVIKTHELTGMDARKAHLDNILRKLENPGDATERKISRWRSAAKAIGEILFNGKYSAKEAKKHKL